MPGPIQFVPTLRSEFGGPRSARARQRAHPSCPTAGLWAYMHAQASTPTACLRRDLPVGAGRRLPCWAAEFADGTHSLEETYQLASTGPENPAETHVMQEQLDRVRLHLEPIEPSARWLRQCNLALRPTAGFGPTQQSLRPDLVVEVGLTQTARGADPTYRARAHQIETAVAQVVLTESVQGQTARLGHRAAVLHDFRHLEKSAGGRFLIPEHSLCTRVNARSGGNPHTTSLDANLARGPLQCACAKSQEYCRRPPPVQQKELACGRARMRATTEAFPRAQTNRLAACSSVRTPPA